MESLTSLITWKEWYSEYIEYADPSCLKKEKIKIW